MSQPKAQIAAPGPDDRSARTTAGQVLRAPADWVLVPPGDAGLTRRIKAVGPTWTVQEKVGRRTFSRGVWASRAGVESIRRDLAAERATPQYTAEQAAVAQRRDREQAECCTDFRRWRSVTHRWQINLPRLQCADGVRAVE